MKRAFALVAMFISVANSAVAQQRVQFPYEAKVVSEGAYVRSGAGDPDRYYPTQKLEKDSMVTVLRHDPGGWFMIEPPQGSFSWVPERYVNRVSDEQGEIKEGDVVAWVGSEFGDECSVWQCRMKSGQKVKILDRRQLETQSGPQMMLKIEPPTREKRWIPGNAVVPVDDAVRQQMNSDPYQVPGNAKRAEGAAVTPSDSADNRTAMRGGVEDVPPIGPSSQLAHLQQVNQEKRQLAEIDSRFREMVLQDVGSWDLDLIEGEYRSLQQLATSKPISGLIDMRYPAIERYRRRMSKLMEMKQLTSKTEAMDAQLLARNSGSMFNAAPALSSPGPEAMMAPGQAPQLAEAFENFLQRDVSNIANKQEAPDVSEAMPITEPGQASNVILPGSPQNQYIGAGIIQKVAEASPGTSGYVLAAPSGKILADLKPTRNINLDAFVGQQVGVQGSRWSEKEKRDVIEVSNLETVRLRQ
jgi:hypothetical protein